MADNPEEHEGPSLELPSLFRRRKQAHPAPEAEPTAPAAATQTEPATQPVTPSTPPTVDESGTGSSPKRPLFGRRRTAQPDAAAEPPVTPVGGPVTEPDGAPEPAGAASTDEPADTAATQIVTPVPAAADAAPPGAGTDSAEPSATVPSTGEAADESPTKRSLFGRRKASKAPVAAAGVGAETAPTSTGAVASESPATDDTPTDGTETDGAPTNGSEPAQPKSSRRPRLRTIKLPGWVAALVTGLLMGLLIVGLTAAFERGCAAIRGTSSCGSAGLWLNLLSLIIAIVVGSLLLKLFGQTDTGSTSFLAVGLVVVIAMLFFLGSIFSWQMIIVIPVLSALAYLAAQWVTSSFVGAPADRWR